MLSFRRFNDLSRGFSLNLELTNEDNVILGGEGSTGKSVEGHDQEKDGFPACLLAAQEVEACGAGWANNR